MCGRFVSTTSAARMAALFEAEVLTEDLGERYNIAPTNRVYTIVPMSEVRAVRSMRWGLVPSWAKDLSIGARMINARAETVADKPSFRNLLPTRRCIVPMDGFFEWRPGTDDGPRTKAGRPARQPVHVHRRDGGVLAVAGLWSTWLDRAADASDPAGAPHQVETVTVITCGANAAMSAIHDRMPVILGSEALDIWMDPEERDRSVLTDLLVPAADDVLVIEPVSTAVNDVRHQGPALIEPI